MSPKAATSCPTASDFSRYARPGAVAIRCRMRCARCGSRPIAERCCASCRTTSMPAHRNLYRRRWAIELFFRWVKQTLKITRFIGNSENAVRIQIAIALITFLLLRLAQAAQKAITSPIVFARLVRANLMHRRAIDYLLHPPPNLTQHQLQLSLGLCQI